MTRQFKCTNCGECCKRFTDLAQNNANAPEWLKKAIEEFPFQINEDGSCEKLIDNKCSVYQDRPTICSVDKLFELQEAVKSKKEWYQMNNQECNRMINESNLDPKYLIEIQTEEL